MAQKNNRKQQNYFSRNIEEYGMDFLDTSKTAEMLSRDAPRIIRDIVFGKISYPDYINFITQPKMINALLEYCNRKYQFHTISTTAMSYYTSSIYNSGMSIDPETQNVYEINSRLSYAYGLLYKSLDYVKVNPDPNVLMIMTNELRDYRNYITKY